MLANQLDRFLFRNVELANEGRKKKEIEEEGSREGKTNAV